MKAIWTKTKPEYHGEFVNFDPMMTWPKPVQKPHPPIHVGGAFPYAARRAIRYGDGWIPVAGRGDIAECLPEVPPDGARGRARSRRPSKSACSDWARTWTAETLRRPGRRARGPDVPAGESGQGVADGRPVGKDHAAGERIAVIRRSGPGGQAVGGGA